MTTRSYEVSFRAVLDDRQVDELADTLFELGYDGACFRPLEAPKPPSREEWLARWERKYDGSRADSTADRDALRAADQHETQRSLKW